jgi:hypothetical protein
MSTTKNIIDDFDWMSLLPDPQPEDPIPFAVKTPEAPPKIEAEVLPFPPKLSERELWERQQVIDACWERTLEAKRALEEEAARSCHRGPGDPDYER